MSLSVAHAPHVCRCPQRPEGVRFLELELQVVVNHQMWVLRTKLGDSLRAICVLIY